MDSRQQTLDLIPTDLIRIETALARYPIHRLARKGSVEIEIRNKETAFRWGVAYTRKYGQPGPLAYKLDTLIINRRIEEARRPLPKIIRLGSLLEISKQLGMVGTRNTNKVKKALLQNAAAFISAKIVYKTREGGEREIEFADNRYGVVFTGEQLPDGRVADAVYIILHEWYQNILDTAQTRPLDYDYLVDLTPAAQRLYELLSFQVYGAIEGGRKRARLLYSEFCTFAPQTRYSAWGYVRPQMHRLHKPHLKSGYLKEVSFNQITSKDGRPDWEIYYTPGKKALGEHTAAKHKPRSRRPQQFESPPPPPRSEDQEGDRREEKQADAAAHGLTDEQQRLIEALCSYGVVESEAQKLVLTKPEACRQKIPAVPYLPQNQGKTNRAGNVRAFIERDDWQLPQSYLEALAKAEEARKAQEKQAAIAACSLCDAQGRRLVITEQYPRGAMKPCSHDPQVEHQNHSAADTAARTSPVAATVELTVCPDCSGTGFYYPAGYEQGVKKCRHARRSAVQTDVRTTTKTSMLYRMGA